MDIKSTAIPVLAINAFENLKSLGSSLSSDLLTKAGLSALNV